jgi:radical SAM protein (TIGR01212 family)
MVKTQKRYNTLSDFLKKRFGCRVYKVSLNAGFTCPNRDGVKGTGGCIYCEPATLVPKDYTEGQGITEQLSCGIEKVRKRHRAEKFIAYFQINTNTYGDIDKLRSLYTEALRHPEVIALAVSTRPDCVDDTVLDLLKEIKEEKYLWLELGLQSANEGTLRFIKRGHTAEEFKDAVERAAERGMDVCAHLVIGLPGEGKADIINTVKFISRLPVWGVKFHQLQLIKGTPLEDMYKRGEVKTVGLEDYAALVVDCLERLSPQVVIHRLSGDVPKEFLAAPLWGANKFEVTERIERLLQKRNTRQGTRWSG